MGGDDNSVKNTGQCYTSIAGLQICEPKSEPAETIKVDLSKTIADNAAKARAFKPKWAPYKPKGPGAFFGDGSDYKKAVAKKDAPTKKEAPKVTPTVVASKKEEPKKVVAAPKSTATDSGIIKVDLSKLLKPGVDKALAYKPKWGTHKPKAPTAFFPDAAAYAKGPKAHKGPATATAGVRAHVKPPKAQPSLFLTTSYNGKQGTYALGRVFDTRNPRQLEELKALKAGAKTYEQSMTPVRVTYVENGKVKTDEIPLLFVTDQHLTPPPVRR
jgi:hypothetical protein